MTIIIQQHQVYFWAVTRASSAAKMPVEFQNDMIIVTSNLAASRPLEILR